MTDTASRHACARGFTLLETLVALSILGASLVAILAIFSQALQAAAQAEAITRATRAGESLLNQVGVELPLSVGVSHGELGPALHWQLSVQPYQPDPGLASWQMPLQAYWVEVEIGWEQAGQARSVRLGTLRLARNGGLAS